jgi:carboxyl-terminal processing protease
VRHVDGSEEEFTIERNEVEISTVFSCPGVDLNGTPSDEDLGVDCPLTELDGREVDNIAYLRIEQFTGTAPDDVEEALEAVAEGGYDGLIVDLRNNPGGLVTATVEISDMFLEEGQIFREVNSDGDEQVYDARGDDILGGMPVVILVNDLSASGSEVFAAALQQNDGRGYVIGDVTFGKGTVNILRELSDGGGLYVSTAQWFTPNDDRIENIGISPDLEFCATDQEIDDVVDSQLQAAIDYLQGEDVAPQSCGPSQQAASE